MDTRKAQLERIEGLVPGREQASNFHCTRALEWIATAFCCAFLAGLEQLRHCTCLQTLNISCIKVNGSFMSTLTSLRSLTARECSYDVFTGESVKVLFGDCGKALAGLTNLTALDIGENDVAAGTPHLHSQCRHKARLAL